MGNEEEKEEKTEDEIINIRNELERQCKESKNRWNRMKKKYNELQEFTVSLTQNDNINDVKKEFIELQNKHNDEIKNIQYEEFKNFEKDQKVQGLEALKKEEKSEGKTMNK